MENTDQKQPKTNVGFDNLVMAAVVANQFQKSLVFLINDYSSSKLNKNILKH